MEKHYAENLRSVTFLIFGFSLVLLFASLTSLVQAASPISGSGLNTQVSPPVPLPSGQTQYNITGGTRPGGGTNLYHSFGDFNVPNNNIANFLNNSGLATSNILGRVTGGNLSNIFGTIQATGFGNANLFLMNPAGFLFGPNATVNVGGMVSFTSADYLRLADGVRFNAIPNPGADAILSAAPVAAFGFLGSNPGAITVQGSQLSVTPSQSLSLVGGNITIKSGTDNGTVQSAKLSAPGGQINLASVASPGEILTGTLAQAPNINGHSFGNLGAIQITEQSVIDVSGNGGGTVLIRGGQFLLDNSTISANVTGPGPIINGAESIGAGIDIQVSQDAVIQNAAVIETNILGNATPGVTYGGVHVKADRIEILGSQDFDNFPATGIRSDVAQGSTGGNSGNIRLEANSFFLEDFGTFSTVIESVTQGAGNSGNIFVTAANNIEMTSPDSSGGSFTVQTASSGDYFFFGGNFTASGNAGNIQLTSTNGNILMSNGAFVTSQTLPDSSGHVGNITVNAAGNISMTAATREDGPAGISTHIDDLSNSGGQGGILVTARNLSILNSSIQIDNFTPFVPGNISLNLSGSLNLSSTGSQSQIVTTTRGPATSANLNLTAHDILVTGNRALISTESRGAGSGGQLNLFANTIQLLNGAQVRSNSGRGVDPRTGIPLVTSGNGGTISIEGLDGPTQSILIDGSGSGILTNAVGIGTGGNTNISAQSLTIQNGGTISAATSGTAPSATGGTILVKADTVNISSGGTMTAASTGAGPSGEVVVQGLASPAQSIVIDGTGSGIFSDTHGTGAGGNISVTTNSVTLQNSGTLSAVTGGTAPSATGGTITVNAEHLAVNSQAVITADTNGIAPAGTIDINTGSLAINGGGRIQSNNGAEQQLVRALTTAPTLTGGTITIEGRTGPGSQADSVTVDGAGSGIFTQSSGNRPGGDINILTSGSVTMTNGASISASSTGSGNAGNIQINAGNQLAMNNSSVTTEANQASGGAIKITTTPSGTVQLTDSTISASVLDGTGGGGSVNIDPQFVILQNSQILANAVFGSGGNINITTNLLLPDSTSQISASSQFGQQGTIIIQSPISPASGKIVPLGQKPLLATTLLSQRCAALAGGNASSFTVAGRDALPVEPGGWLSSPLALAISESNGGPISETGTDRSGSEHRETSLLSLRRIAPPGFLTQSFATDLSAGCTS